MSRNSSLRYSLHFFRPVSSIRRGARRHVAMETADKDGERGVCVPSYVCVYVWAAQRPPSCDGVCIVNLHITGAFQWHLFTSILNGCRSVDPYRPLHGNCSKVCKKCLLWNLSLCLSSTLQTWQWRSVTNPEMISQPSVTVIDRL